jgi:hypothetical protein
MILEHINKCKYNFNLEFGKEPNTLFLGILNFDMLLEELDSHSSIHNKDKINCTVFGLKVKVLAEI